MGNAVNYIIWHRAQSAAMTHFPPDLRPGMVVDMAGFCVAGGRRYLAEEVKMAKHNKPRRILEENIIENAKSIRIKKNEFCFDEAALVEYAKSWHELIQYYRNPEICDFEMSIDLIQLYLYDINYFFALSKDDSLPEDCRARAYEMIQELEANLNYIVEAVEIWMYPNGRIF
jgi:hypothetical protein